MKGQWSITHGQALFYGILAVLLIIVAYSYILYHTISINTILDTFNHMYQALASDPIPFGVIFLIGLAIGWLQGKAY